jgi:hypothetical protein
MSEGRRLWAGLQILDRQIIDRDDRFAGNVDDLVFEPREDGALIVTGLRSGAGALPYRLGARRFGRWLQRVRETLEDGDGVIALGDVSLLGNHVRVARSVDDLASDASERWVRDHIINRIPGSGDAAE